MMRIFESLLEESGKKRFIKKWLPDDSERVEEYDKAYEEFAQVFDNEVKKRGLNWQTSMSLGIFEEILNDVKDRKSKAELKKQNKAAGKSDFLSYVIANPDCDLTYLGTVRKWDYFKIETWPGAMLADSPKSSLNGDTGAKWCIGWKDPTKQKFDDYTRKGLDFILIVKSDNSNTDEEEKYCIQIKRDTGEVEGIWTPIDNEFTDKELIYKILYAQEFKTKERRISGILKGIDISIKEAIQPENKIVDLSIGLIPDEDLIEEDTFYYKLYKSGTNQLINNVAALEFIALKRLPKYFFNLTKLDNLEKIILPEGLKVIENDCFYNSRIIKYNSSNSIKHIEIPDSVEEIGKHAFNNWKGLESIKLPANLKKIGVQSFNNCISLKHVELPDSVEEIGDGAFILCKSLLSVKLPANLKKISSSLFDNCEKLHHIEIPESVEEIGSHAFGSCYDLKSIKLPANLKKIGHWAFGACGGLKHIEVPDSVEVIGEGAFGTCSNLESVKLPANLRKISKDTFFWCKNLKHIEIPNSVEEIGKGAFQKTGITDQSLIDEIKSINEKAFA